ncbi:MAG: hypothetical protein FWD78_11320 [Treponema sp.]|nr:hypothetical protein [Treponema sp.]
MKKITLVLTVLLITTAVVFAGGAQGGAGTTNAPAAAAQGGIPSYINLDGYFPVVKQGTNVSMTVSWLPDQTFAKTSNPDDLWYFTFVKKAMNIDLKVTPRADGAEAKNLMFASGDLPDIWMAGITPDDVVNFGIGEKLIIPVTSYINPTLMPNLSKVYSDDPDLKSPSVAPDGNMYGFSNFRAKDWLHGPITGGLARAFFNQKWLDQLGLKVPETLDDYLNVLRKFKTLGSDVLPDAGIFTAQNNFCELYSALGFHWTGYNGITAVGTRNGKATFVYGDKEIYPKFVQTMKTMYDEGLITRDFFTMTNSARVAITMAGKGGVIPAPPVTMTSAAQYFDYVSVKPLTSELNSKQFWVAPSNYAAPNVIVLTSKCKYPEAACRMLDYDYNVDTGLTVQFGFPDIKPDLNYGMIPGWSIGINDNFVDMHFDPAQYESENYFAMTRIRPLNNMPGMVGNNAATAKKAYGLNPPKEDWDITNADSFSRKTTYENVSIYSVTEFPFTVYWDQQTSKRLSDLGSVLNDYASTQFAQFVTGARPLSDMNNYFADLDKMGYQEYLKYFVDYYENVKASN